MQYINRNIQTFVELFLLARRHPYVRRSLQTGLRSVLFCVSMYHRHVPPRIHPFLKLRYFIFFMILD